MGFKKFLIGIFFILLIGIAPAHQGDDFIIPPDKKPVTKSKTVTQAVIVVKPEPFAISSNIVFLVDASSSISNSNDIKKRFNKAWDYITAQFAMDELYFSVCVFHDKGKSKFRPWVHAGGMQGIKEFAKAKAWILKNTGLYSWARKALGKSLRQINHLNKNYNERMRLTVVIISDGGFTEAAKYIPKTKKVKGKNVKESYYKPIWDMIVSSQRWRISRGMAQASILTVGITNKYAWSYSVKRPDSECQDFLKAVGKSYGGGYVLIKDKK